MKVCIFGAGAVGGNAAARLIAARDAEVSVVARGAHLAAIRDKGSRCTRAAIRSAASPMRRRTIPRPCPGRTSWW